MILLAGLIAHCRPHSGSLPPVSNLVLVSIDSLRADHVGAYGYERPTTPRLDELARQGIVFERAYSTTSWTLPAHAALFSGLDDYAHGVVDGALRLPDAVQTLAERLRRQGIHTTAFFSGPYLHPSFGLDQGFDEYVDCTSYGWRGGRLGEIAAHQRSHRDVTNPILLERIAAWLAGARPEERHFIFVHMWDVHYDYIPPPSYVRMFDADYRGAMTGDDLQDNRDIRPGMPRRDLEHLVALYDGEIRYTDDTLGEILTRFANRGLLEDTAIVVTADHGEEFLDHGGKGHAATLFEEVLRVPMIVWISGRPSEQRRVEDVVSLVDILPTACELLGVACGYTGPGVSLLPYHWGERPGEARLDALAELSSRLLGRYQTALVRGESKLVRSNQTGAMHYYRLDVAAGREVGVPVGTPATSVRPPEVAAMVRRLSEREAAARRTGRSLQSETREPSEAEIDAPTREQLRALGYLD